MRGVQSNDVKSDELGADAQVFGHIKQAIGKLILKYTGDLAGAPNASELAGIAIQNS